MAGRVDPEHLGKSLQPSYDARSTQSMLQDQALPGKSGVVPEDSTDVHSSFALLLRAATTRTRATSCACVPSAPETLGTRPIAGLGAPASRHRRHRAGHPDAVHQAAAGFTPQHERAFCAYVSQALRNRLRDAMRRALTRPAGQPLSPEEPAGDPSPLEQAVGVQMLNRYDSALQRLREPDRGSLSRAWNWGWATARSPASWTSHPCPQPVLR